VFRPTTSEVSALSSCVANSRQAMHSVSPTPSKIPYGGFSPVRLQTGARRRDLRSLTKPSLYATTVTIPADRRSSRSRLSPSGSGSSNHHNLSSGPWLPARFCCPGRSSLTMATSEPLEFPDGLSIIPLGWVSPKPQRVPSLLCQTVPSCHPQCPGGSKGCLRLFLRPWSCLRPLCRGSASALATHVELAWLRNEVVSGSLSLRPDGSLALPRPGRLLSSFHPLGRPNGCRVSLRCFQSFTATGLSPASLTALWAANRGTESSEPHRR